MKESRISMERAEFVAKAMCKSEKQDPDEMLDDPQHEGKRVARWKIRYLSLAVAAIIASDRTS